MSERYDVVVIGSGPAGQKAAIAGSKAGRRVALIERSRSVGGACLHRGTIPSKTLRAAAIEIAQFRRRAATWGIELHADVRAEHLTERLSTVISSHVGFLGDQLERNDVEVIRGSAAFIDAHHLVVTAPGGGVRAVSAPIVIIATGSVPREPPGIVIDHEHVLDSDSILALEYLPRSLTILGGGVIACEYASIFATLGVSVTVVDRGPRPLGFLDPELSDQFRRSFEQSGGRYLANANLDTVVSDGFGTVTTTLEDGTVVQSAKLMVALGRVPATGALRLEAAGVETDKRARIVADDHGQTNVEGIYAAGDVVGFPALASYSMEQGRRAIAHALGDPLAGGPPAIPMGIFTVPEIGCVGQTEAEAGPDARVGRATFGEIARGHIAGDADGFLKLIAAPDGRILGVGIVGEGATELVAVGQMAILGGATIHDLIDNVFNFPTLAEAYRVAALQIAQVATARAA